MLRYILMACITFLTLVSRATDLTVLLGTDGNPESEGIYTVGFDPQSGRWTSRVELAAPVQSAGFQALHPTLPVVYTAGMQPGAAGQQVSAYKMAWSGEKLVLDHLNRVPTDNDLVTHLAVDPEGKLLVTAQYRTGTVAVFPLQDDGSLEPRAQLFDHGPGSGVDPDRQDQARPHCVVFAPGGRHVLVCDLGTDAVHVYRVDRQGARLIPHQKAPAPPGSGPRHLKFSPDGRFALVLNELDLTVSTYAWEERTGNLELLHVTPTLSEATKEGEVRNTASEIAIHPGGRFVYSANRGHDSITVFEMDRQSGRLQVLEVEPARAAWPRHFAIDPGGRWLLCGGQDSSNVGIFAIHPDTGLLTYQPGSSIGVPHPICVTFVQPGE